MDRFNWEDYEWFLVNRSTGKRVRSDTCLKCREGVLSITKVHDTYATLRLAFEGDDEDEGEKILRQNLHLAVTECPHCNDKDLRWVKAVEGDVG